MTKVDAKFLEFGFFAVLREAEAFGSQLRGSDKARLKVPGRNERVQGMRRMS